MNTDFRGLRLKESQGFENMLDAGCENMMELEPHLMHSDRRSFLRIGSLLVCGSIIRPHALFGFKTPGILSFSAAEMRVLDFVASYSSVARVIGASVLGRMSPDRNCGLHLLVEVRDFIKLTDAFWNAPFKNIYANGNGMSFSFGSATVIENLSAEEFAARLAGLGGKDVVFAHDAIVYDPAAKTLNDPFDALNAGELKLLNRPTKTSAALDVALRGSGEAHAAGIAEGKDFAQWKSQLVRLTVHSSAAQPLAAVFMKRLPSLVALAGTDEAKSLVATPLISSAVSSALGMNGRTAIAEFDRVRAIFGESYSDSAVWFYVLLGKQMRTDMRGWITPELSADPHWREAFNTAVLIVEAFQSPQLKSQA